MIEKFLADVVQNTTEGDWESFTPEAREALAATMGTREYLYERTEEGDEYLLIFGLETDDVILTVVPQGPDYSIVSPKGQRLVISDDLTSICNVLRGLHARL